MNRGDFVVMTCESIGRALRRLKGLLDFFFFLDDNRARLGGLWSTSSF